MLSLPQTADYALRAVLYIAEHDRSAAVPVSTVARALGAPANYLSKTLYRLGGLGVLQPVRGAQGGYRLGAPADRLRLADIVGPFVVASNERCIMGRPRCRSDAPCGAHRRWREVQDTAKSFFANLTVADVLTRS